MLGDQEQLESRIVAEIRRIVRAIEIQSQRLVHEHGLTAPQLLTLREVARLGPVSVSVLARQVNVSQPTMTGILGRLERSGLIRRERAERDRREVLSTVTPQGLRTLRGVPSLLQDHFHRELSRLAAWEQTQVLATLQRIAAMMDAEHLEAAPLLTTDPLAVEPQDAAHAAESAADRHTTPTRRNG